MTPFRTLIVAATAFVLAAPAAQALSLPNIHAPKGVEARAAGLSRYAGPKVRNFVAKEGAIEAGANAPSVGAVRAAIARAGFSKLSDAQVNVLCFLVFAQAVDDEVRDLARAMTSPGHTQGRGAVGVAAPGSDGYSLSGLKEGDYQQTIDKFKGDVDSKSEVGEQESMRLQMAMDRLSKLMDTLSNLMKAISNTSEQITQNIK